MSLKEKLQNLRKIITINKGDIILQEETIDLNKKVDNFIEWSINKNGKNLSEATLLRNFIEKMAVWYELRYPRCEINKILYDYDGKETLIINEIMFTKNEYIKDIIDENSDVKYFDWADFYNTQTFIKSLPYVEKILLSRPRYDYRVELSKNEFINLYVTSNGYIERVGSWYKIFDSNIRTLDINKYFKGKHITEAKEIAKKLGISLDKNCGVDRAIENYEKEKYSKEELLNCVMYRLIERDKFDGAKRALIFANEFNRNINIPMIYGARLHRDGLKEFIEFYLKLGGTKDLICFTNYPNLNAELEKHTIEEILKIEYSKDDKEKKKELQERLLTILASQLSEEKIEQAQKVKIKKVEDI